MLHLLAAATETEGCACVTLELREERLEEIARSVGRFLRLYHPRALIYDLSPPPEAAIQAWSMVERLPEVEGLHTILTTTDIVDFRRAVFNDRLLIEVPDRRRGLDPFLVAIRRLCAN